MSNTYKEALASIINIKSKYRFVIFITLFIPQVAIAEMWSVCEGLVEIKGVSHKMLAISEPFEVNDDDPYKYTKTFTDHVQDYLGLVGWGWSIDSSYTTCTVWRKKYQASAIFDGRRRESREHEKIEVLVYENVRYFTKNQ